MYCSLVQCRTLQSTVCTVSAIMVPDSDVSICSICSTHTQSLSTFTVYPRLKMAAGLYAPWGVEMAYEQTGPVTRG